MSSLIQPMPFVFPVIEPETPEGTLIYFHPGGLPSKTIKQMTSHLTNWRIYVVELMLCAEFVESINQQGELQTSIPSIAKNIQSQLAIDDFKDALFVGWSFGGVIAYEVASLFEPEHQPKLVLLDSIAPISEFKFSDKNVASMQIVQWFMQYIQSLKGCVLQKKFKWYFQSDTNVILNDLLEQAKVQSAFDRMTKLVGFRKVFETFTQGLIRNTRLTAQYNASPYQQPVMLIRASNGMLNRFKWIRHMGWKSLIPNLTIKTLNCDHYQMISTQSTLSNINALISDFCHETQLIEQHPLRT